MKNQFVANLVLSICLLIPFQLFSQTLDQRLDNYINLLTLSEKMEQLSNNSFMTTSDNNRLGIPGFIMDDGPHGVRFQSASAFPTGMAMTSTWDRSLLQQLGKAMGTEFWAFGKHQQLGPCIDLSRDPRAGRSAESGGEDSYLAGQVGAYLCKGIQMTPVIATLKHFIGEGKQAYRSDMNLTANRQLFMDQYSSNFRYAYQESGAMSIMSSYNQINGIQSSANKLLLDSLLRQTWGFPFYVVSDWAAVEDSKAAIKAGNDVCMGSEHYRTDMVNLVNSGQVTLTEVNALVRNVLRTKILAGMTDYYPKSSVSNANTADIKAINENGARKSIILLKNTNNILPLNKTKKVALIGPNADKGNLNCFGSSETTPPYSISDKNGIETKIGAANVLFARGCDINSTSTTGFQAAVDIAKQADVVVFVGGLDDTQEGEGYNSGSDRIGGSIALPGKQQDLINTLASANPNIIVILHSGGVVSINNCINNIKGLIYSFYPGQQAGTAIADVLFGDYNPAGRMPVTMPKNDGQWPIWNDDMNDDFAGGYHWFDEKALIPEFAFGAGLSYTTFAYSNLTISPASAPVGTPVAVTVDVENTGSRDGEEVVQLYLSKSTSSIWRPKKELKGFERVALKMGEKKTVTVVLTADELYNWNLSKKMYDVEAGTYTALVGGASDKLTQSGDFTLTASTNQSDLRITQIYTMPRYPRMGEKVQFLALVKNQGTATITTNNSFRIDFNVGGSLAAQTASVSTTIPTGGTALIACDPSIWSASSSGKTSIIATVDAGAQISELIETNNSFEKEFELFESNIALNKTVQVSSSQNNTLTGAMMVDGSATTRWSSAFSEPHSAIIDLAGVYELNRVVLNWETASAKAYDIYVSTNQITWGQPVFSTTTGNGGIQIITTNAIGRYIKLVCKTRNNPSYGFSLWEFEAYGQLLVSVTAVTVSPSIGAILLGESLQLTASVIPSNATIKTVKYVSSDTKVATVDGNGLVLSKGVGITEIKCTTDDGAFSSTCDLVVKDTSTGLLEPNNLAISIYPNPTNSSIFIKNLPHNGGVLELIDVNGSCLYSQVLQLQKSELKIDLAGFAKGFYIIKIQSNDEVVLRKIVKQ